MKKGGPKKTPVLDKPRALRQGEPGYGKKRKVVYVKNPKTGNVKTIKFGDAKLGLGVSSPARRARATSSSRSDAEGPCGVCRGSCSSGITSSAMKRRVRCWRSSSSGESEKSMGPAEKDGPAS